MTSVRIAPPEVSPSRLQSPLSRVAHLTRRAGFGLPPRDLDRLAAGGVAEAIHHYVDYDHGNQALAPRKPVVNDDPNNGDVTPLQKWWLDRMIRSPRQLEEKMTLFWHNFFATSADKVGIPTLMYDQNMLFRKHALGDFQELLTEIAIDRAMLTWLDGDGSTKEHPNENFSRESMELFSIGVGHYSQRDVQEAARAFTGWYLDDHLRRHFDRGSHDSGAKQYLGQSGRFTYSDVTRILANHPACGRFLARKLWTFFAYDHPDNSIVEELAGVYRGSSRSIKAVVRHMFGMPAFYRVADVPMRVKSPVEYAVTAVRELDARVSLTDLNDSCAVMGQALFYPPNVGGWPSGVRWISSATVVARFGFAEWLLEQHSNPKMNRVSLDRLQRLYPVRHMTAAIDRLVRYHLPANTSPATLTALIKYGKGSLADTDAKSALEGLLQLVLVSPEYYCA